MASKNNFMGTNVSAFNPLTRNIIVLGYRAFESKSGNPCYIIDTVSKHKVESVFVDESVFLVVHEYGCGEYTVFRDDRGRIEDIEFVATFNDCIAN